MKIILHWREIKDRLLQSEPLRRPPSEPTYTKVAKNVIERCFSSGISEGQVLKSLQQQEKIARATLTKDLQDVHTPYKVENSNNYMKMMFYQAVCVVLKEGEYLEVLKKGRAVEEEDGFVLVKNEDEEWQFVHE